MSYQEGYQNVIKASGVKLAQARNPERTYTLTPQRNQVGNLGQRQGFAGMGGNTDRAAGGGIVGAGAGTLAGLGRGSKASRGRAARGGLLGGAIGTAAGLV